MDEAKAKYLSIILVSTMCGVGMQVVIWTSLKTVFCVYWDFSSDKYIYSVM